MDRFDGYRWQDHIVRPGWWRLDMLLAAVSICVVSATFEPGRGGEQARADKDLGRDLRCEGGAPAADTAGNSPQAAGTPDRRCAERPEIARDWMPSSKVGNNRAAGPSS